MECVPADKWVLLFLTNAKAKSLNIRDKKNSALVTEKEFREFYGYTYANRAQFASGKFVDLNSSIFLN
jgi:hypothetical protein